jgi:ribosomal protein S18 acetylase RimI-like enzyme
MQLEFVRVVVPKELRSLVTFDRKVFCDHPGDWFDRESWRHCEPWWMIVDRRKAGCCAFRADTDFQEDIRDDGENAVLAGSLYVVTTGILPALQGRALGGIMKAWQVAYAKHHGFTRIVTNTRKSNKSMIALNQKFGFSVMRTTPRYYSGPSEATVVMERLLGT